MAFLTPTATAAPPTMMISVGTKTRSPRKRALVQGSGSSSTSEMEDSTSGLFRHDSRPIMLFDGVCNLCNGGVRFVRSNDRNRMLRFEPLQSDVGRSLLRRSGRSPDDISSVVLVEKNRSYVKSEAVLKIMDHLDLPFPQLAFFLNLVPLDFTYEIVADNRYAFFGRSETCDV